MSEPHSPPLSPCIKVCVVDRDRGQCTGCGRTLAEIAGWWTMRDDEKRAVLAALPGRMCPSWRSSPPNC